MFQIANYIEAGFWILLGVGIGIRGYFRPQRHAHLIAIASATLILFGISDIVETRTGAWWNPWWLLIWKVACTSTLVAIVAIYYRSRSLRP